MTPEKENENREKEDRERTASFGYRTVGTTEKKKLVSNEFDSIATRYDLANALLSFGLQFLWKRTAVRLLRLEPGEVVLDLCGGTADLALLAARQIGPEGRIVVYDINRTMMEVGRVKAKKGGFEDRLVFIQGDAEKAGLCDASFDAVMAGFGIRNLAHLEDGLAETCRVLKKGGRFMCLEFSMPTLPWFRKLYDLYSFNIMPVAGRLITGNGRAFSYLAESIRVFPSADHLAGLMREKGFSTVTYRRLTNGIAAVHLAKK